MLIDVSELNKLAADLGRASTTVVERSSLAIRKTAYDIEADAKRFCPVDTGNLRNSISTDTHVLSAEIGPTAEYAAFVEYGTSRMAPEAFMGPAFDRHAGELVTALEQIAGEML